MLTNLISSTVLRAEQKNWLYVLSAVMPSSSTLWDTFTDMRNPSKKDHLQHRVSRVRQTQPPDQHFFTFILCNAKPPLIWDWVPPFGWKKWPGAQIYQDRNWGGVDWLCFSDTVENVGVCTYHCPYILSSRRSLTSTEKKKEELSKSADHTLFWPSRFLLPG